MLTAKSVAVGRYSYLRNRLGGGNYRNNIFRRGGKGFLAPDVVLYCFVFLCFDLWCVTLGFTGWGEVEIPDSLILILFQFLGIWQLVWRLFHIFNYEKSWRLGDTCISATA